MNHAIPATAGQSAAPSDKLPAAGYRDAREEATGPAAGERNPAQTDDSPDAILGYN